MNTLLRHIKDAFLALSNTERRVYNGASDTARRTRVALGLAVIVVPLLSASFMGHFFHVALGSVTMAVVLGILWATIVGIFDFILVSGTARWNLTLIPRFGLAVLIGYMVAVPVELKLFEDRIQQHLEQENRDRYEERMTRLKEEHSLPAMQTRIDSLTKQKSKAQAEITRAQRIQECELTGVVIQGLPCTGIRGPGQVYDNAVRNEKQARRQVQQIESELTHLRARRDSLREVISRNNDKPETLRDPLAQYEALEEITKESDAAAMFSWALHLFFIGIEVMLVLAKLLREEDDYDAGKRHFIEAKKELDHRRIECFKKERLQEIEDDPKSRPVPTLASFLGSKRRQTVPWNEHVPSQNEGPQQERDEDPVAGTAQKEERGSEDKGKAHWNGRKLYSFAGALILIAFLELFTSVAPVQRVAGNTVNAMPQFMHEAMMGEEAAQRYEHLQAFIEGQGKQEIISVEGTSLTRRTANPDFPESLRTYLVQIENHRFYRRYVVDWHGFGRAILYSIKEWRITGGGSGLIQQLTGSVVLRNGGTMREGGWGAKVAAKLAEYFVAWGLRDRFSPEKLLRLYMQGIYLGQGPRGPIQGFEEAAWAYFDAPVERLAKAQQLALVALLPAPNWLSGNAAAFADRYDTVIDQLLEQDAITAAEADRLRRARPAMHHPRESPDTRKIRLATRHAQRYVQEHAADSTTTIYSTISTKISVAGFRVLQRAVHDLEARTGVEDIEGFVLVAEDGKLTAMIGSVTGKGFNRADSLTAYRPGSLPKPLLYTEYIAQGGSTSDRLPVLPQTFTLANGQAWRVKNYSNRYDHHAPMSLRRALARSINVAAASVAVSPVMDQFRRRMKHIGYGDAFSHPSSVLGARAEKPLRLYRLLQAFVQPYGKIPRRFQLAKSEPTRRLSVWPPSAAERIAFTLSYAVTDSLGTLSPGRRCCGWTARTHRGKTGTGQAHTAASLFMARPGGVSVLMGVFSRSGKSLVYQERKKGVAGATLIPYMNDLLNTDALRRRSVGRSFNFGAEQEQLAVDASQLISQESPR